MRKIALIGGDSRQISAAFTLKTAGFTPFVYGNDMAAKAGFTAPYTIKETLTDAEAVLLSVPSVKKEGFLYTPLWERNLTISDFMRALPQNTTVFLWGREKCGIKIKNRIVDLEKDEICQKENAHATADAAIFLAMQEANQAIFKMRTVILGYGRIGKYLSKNLMALGAAVKVGARRESSRKEAALMGLDAHPLTDPLLLMDTDVIFNTIPTPILTPEHLKSVGSDTLYLELASAPGALTEDEKKQSHFRILMAPGLPGKYCSHSAGQFLGEAVLRHMKERREAVW